ncbi:MAG TPA: phosphorylase [Pararhizobium sp.]|nr:phosphorylase [Pararhizobium sp.]
MDAPRIVVITGLAFEAEIARSATERVCCGHGAHLTSAIRDAIAEGCDGVISFGIAAGLDSELRPGTVVIASEVVQSTGEAMPTDEKWRASLLDRCRPAVAGKLLGTDEPAVSVETKRQFRAETGASVLDMESHIAATYAAAYGFPFAVLRVVADPANRVVPELAVKAMRADGSSDAVSVMRGLARHPRQLLPLTRIALETWRARRALVQARRRLGPAFGLVDFR